MSLVEENKTYATDAGHYYTTDGEPAYEVPYKDKKRAGEMRPTTIKDCRELGLYPSVTTIMKVIDKGNSLTNWMKRKVAEAAYQVGNPGELESMEAYTEYVLQKAEEAMTAQRDKGSRDHGIVEEYFRLVSQAGHRSDRYEVDVLYADSKPVEAVLAAFGDLGIAGQRIDSEKSFACDLGYGGKIDISGIREGMKTDGIWIVDFKFVDRLEKKKDYVEKVAQGAAYLYGRYGLPGLQYGRFANIFVETGSYEYEVREWTYEEIQHGWEVFDAARILWRKINKYEP